MPRLVLDLNQAADQQKVGGQWRVATGLVPGEPNEGLTARLLASPARLVHVQNPARQLAYGKSGQPSSSIDKLIGPLYL